MKVFVELYELLNLKMLLQGMFVLCVTSNVTMNIFFMTMILRHFVITLQNGDSRDDLNEFDGQTQYNRVWRHSVGPTIPNFSLKGISSLFAINLGSIT